ncbi:ribulose-phosphate 3-epimerase [Herbiconiux sp. A18JL235]|uniref:Ribulose-phosphate 3-epimerase n=1 Tax=Herbiconiux sp. A18JL235 TaxID=3152363 RepID=A0AB39BIN7_9MICO
MSVRIHPSILAADFAHLADDLERIRTADLIHFDVMDYHFVPNLSFGMPLFESIAANSPLPLDVHLMISDPLRWAPGYAEAGAESVTFHAEATESPAQVAKAIRAAGARVGLALKPGTDVDDYLELLPEIDMVLVMTVEPGFGGQAFMPETMPKLARLREAVDASGLEVRVQVDGGIDERTISIAAENGADTFVAGSSVFGAESAADQIALLRETATAHRH